MKDESGSDIQIVRDAEEAGCSVVCYAPCGKSLLRRNIVVCTFVVLRIRSTGCTLGRTQTSGGVSWSS